MNKIAPISLFVYNRPEHTQRTVEALQKNHIAEESELFIFSDGPKDDAGREKVEEVRNYIRTIAGFKRVQIIERKENIGLAQSIIGGVTDIVNRYGTVIVLEDDLVTSPYFLQYMNDALSLYENDEKVISIHGYIYPVTKPLPETFFLRGADCWGWATWKRGWDLFEADGKKLLGELERRDLTKEFDFEGAYNYSGMLKRQIAGLTASWAIRWYASAFLADKLTLYPGISLVDNIGQDASGTHSNATNVYRTKLSEQRTEVRRIALHENAGVRKLFMEYFRSLKPSILNRIVAKIKRSV